MILEGFTNLMTQFRSETFTDKKDSTLKIREVLNLLVFIVESKYFKDKSEVFSKYLQANILPSATHPDIIEFYEFPVSFLEKFGDDLEISKYVETVGANPNEIDQIAFLEIMHKLFLRKSSLLLVESDN